MSRNPFPAPGIEPRTGRLVLPLRPDGPAPDHPRADPACALQAAQWFGGRMARMAEMWSAPPADPGADRLGAASVAERVEVIASILTHRTFNFQSRQAIAPLLPAVRERLAVQIGQGQPVTLFLLYNGGYRASPWPEDLSLVMEPDQTEWMLIHQIAALQAKVRAVHAPGIDFSIVVNNGVAHWVNGIPLAGTARYAALLRQMLTHLDAQRSVRVLLQSELAGFEADAAWDGVQPPADLSDQAHRRVERFLGRRCSRAEAGYRTALYLQAEARWARELAPVVACQHGLVLRQVAHAAMLSFRPFPGGAIRSQNGSLGLQWHEGRLVPKLITTEGVAAHGVEWVPLAWPGCGVTETRPQEEPVHV